MSTAIEEILLSFNHLSEVEQHEVATEIIRRTLVMPFLPLTDQELLMNADALFLELDQQEAEDE